MFKLVLSIFTVSLCISSIEGQSTFLYENDLCKPGDNRWTCKRLEDCPSAQKGVKTGNRPKICTFIDLEPVVCCGPEANTEPKSVDATAAQPLTSGVSNRFSKSREKCKEYARYAFREELPPTLTAFGTPKPVRYDECGIAVVTLIVGGVDANAKEFPHMAQIGYGDSRRISWQCGGSLISERYVLSAAHCSKLHDSGLAKWARLGDLNIATNKDDAKPIIMSIVQRINHPDWNGVQMYNDIALFKLKSSVTLSPYLRPICLDLGESQTQTAIASGWGHTEWGGHGSDHLKKVLLNLVSTQRCNSSYVHIRSQLPNGISGTSMICAGDKEGKGTCQGDSGGPLQITTKDPYCMYLQIGITSFSQACGQPAPGVYTKVSHFVPWIESIVWP